MHVHDRASIARNLMQLLLILASFFTFCGSEYIRVGLYKPRTKRLCIGTYDGNIFAEMSSQEQLLEGTKLKKKFFFYTRALYIFALFLVVHCSGMRKSVVYNYILILSLLH